MIAAIDSAGVVALPSGPIFFSIDVDEAARKLHVSYIPHGSVTAADTEAAREAVTAYALKWVKARGKPRRRRKS